MASKTNRARVSALSAVVLALALISCHGFFTDPVLTSISITPGNPNVVVGATQQFTATGVNDDGTNAGTVTATWSSSSTNVATIDQTSGLATAVAAGTTTITASSGTGGVSGTTTMTVTTSALQSITVTAASPTVIINGTDQCTAKAVFADNTTKDISSSATWQSSDSRIATVSSTGLVTGVSAGSVTITATSGSISGQATITVSAF